MVDRIKVEVAYALPNKQMIIPLEVDEGTNLKQAVELSKIAEKFSEIDIDNLELGIFGKSEKDVTKTLREGDRVEIYRPLIADPKEVRKKRAQEAKEKKSAK